MNKHSTMFSCLKRNTEMLTLSSCLDRNTEVSTIPSALVVTAKNLLCPVALTGKTEY
jgi:hypothetical protein